MNAKNVAVLLAVVCAVLVGGLIYQHLQATGQQQSDAKTILNFSNNWTQVQQQLGEAKLVNVQLNKDLDDTRSVSTNLSTTLSSASNLLARTRDDLARSARDLEQTQTSLKSVQDDLAKRDARIAELTTQNAALDKQSTELQSAINGLEVAINDTKQKLENAEGDKAVLQGELKRLMAEKAELERQFNDIVILRTQVAKLKEEMSVARRLDWLRRGLYGETKGGQRQMELTRPASVPPPAGTNYDLNVEVHSDGSLKVIPPPAQEKAPAAGQ